jgi:hypothetical protein
MYVVQNFMQKQTRRKTVKRKMAKAKSEYDGINVYFGMKEKDEFLELVREAGRIGVSAGNYVKRLARIGRPLAKKDPVLLLTQK